MQQASCRSAKISIVIPNYDQSRTLPRCLEAALNCRYPDFEVIVVDDKSRDSSLDVIRRYPVRLLRHERNQGPGPARNTGARQAAGQILLFTDADVCLREDTLQKVAETFLSKPDIQAVAGMPEKACCYRNLSSIHFNRRVYFNYLRLPDYIDILYGSISAVKKEAFWKIGGFSQGFKGVEDNQAGLKLRQANFKIYHNKALKISHCKKISFLALLKNDFRRTVVRVKLLLGRKMLKNVLKQKRFISSPPGQMLSPFFSFLFFVFTAASFYNPLFRQLALAAFLAFALLNLAYLKFSLEEEGLLFLIRITALLLIDMLAVWLALIWGGLVFASGARD